MGYEEFKKKVAVRLKYFYGNDTEVKIDTIHGDNGQDYEGLVVAPRIMGA